LDVIPRRVGKLGTFLSIIGPAWVVMMADVDAPSVITAGESGAVFGYHLVFVLLVLIVPLFFIQEAAGRLGAATGKGLAEAVRDHYSRRMAVLAALPMFVTDFLSYTVEYAGIAVALEIFGVSPLISLPVIFLVHASLVFTGSYRRTEKILLLVSAVLLSSYVIDAVLVQPNLGELVTVGFTPIQPFSNPSFGYLIAANVGAVIMPWMLFYQAGAVTQKGLNGSHVPFERLETLIGAIASEILMVAIVVVSASMGSVDFLSPSSLANALVPLAGGYAYLLYGLGLGSAAFLALVVISLASTWGIAEALGWRRRIGEKFSLARNFYLVYLLETLPAVAIPLIFTNLVNLMLSLMVVFVFVTIVPATMLGILCSNRELMGASVMGTKWKTTYWLMLGVVILTGILTVPMLLG
jgi:manganese transport protein